MIKLRAAFAFIGAVFLVQQVEAAVVLTRPDQGPIIIYIPKTTGQRSLLEIGADELAYHLGIMTGKEPEIRRIAEDESAGENAIVVGPACDRFGVVAEATKYQDSVRIVAKGNRVLIAGENDQATLNGVYSFLESMGCDWVLPGRIGEIIPRRNVVEVPEMDRTEKPGFPSRYLWYTGGKTINEPDEIEAFDVWKRRQKIGISPEYSPLGGGHTWQSFIKRHKVDFEEDPTMYALVRMPDGSLVRKGPQLEPTHPRVIELFVQDIEEEFKKNNWPADKVISFPIGPADGLGFSVSPEAVSASSGKVDPLSGYPDVTDNLVLLANTILERVNGKYPNVRVGFYSYSTHESFPTRYKPDPHLDQVFAPINFSRNHSVLDTNTKTWAFFRETVEKWSQLSKSQGNQLGYRGYNWNLADDMSPFSKLKIFADELPWYKKMGITSVNIEFVKAWAVTGPSDFLLAKLLWNPDADSQKIFRDYCEKSFGNGAGEMEKYFMELTKRQHSGEEAGSYQALHLLYDQDFLKSQKALILEAISKAEFPDQKFRAGVFLIPLDHLSLFLEMRESSTRFDFAKTEQLYQGLLKSWQKAYNEHSEFVSKYVPRYLKRYWGSYVEEARRYSSQPYQLVLAIPDELTTMLDPYDAGEQLGFQNTELADSRYIKTKTWSIPWDAQGMGAYRSGSIWYRIPFNLEKNNLGRALGLFLGGCDDQSNVWLNGKLVGRSPAGFSRPYVFDLTASAQEGENMLVIKIARVNAANEIGTGGILRPSFLFTGDHIDLIKVKEERQMRILPGGELAPE